MKDLIYIMIAIPFIISVIIVCNRLKEKMDRKRRRDILEKYNRTLLEKENQELKILEPYENFNSPENKRKHDVPDHFTGGNLWI